MVGSFRTPTHIGTVKRSTEHYDLEVPYFDTPNWGQYIEKDLDAIDALLFSMAGITNIVGVWDNSVDYTVGERVIDADSGFIYECKVTHTSAASGTFAADRLAHPTFWLIMQTGWSFRGAWSTPTDYLEGDIVYDTSEHVVAVATSDHTSTTDIRTDAANWDFIVDLAATVAAAELAETNAEIAETNAETAATTATTQAGIATTQANAAAASAVDALASENAAELAETNAETAQAAAELAQSGAETAQAASEAARDGSVAALDDFTDLYLGPKSSAPTVDNDGDTLQDGALYWNTVAKIFQVWDESSATWYDAPAISVLAENIGYDNSDSGLTATNIQEAVDEIAAFALTAGDKGDVVVDAFGVWTVETSALLSMGITASVTELNYVDGVTSDIQTQINGKQPLDADLTAIAALTTDTYGRSLLTATSEANFKALVNLEIGTDVQAYDADLTTWAGLTPSANFQTLVTQTFAQMRASLDLEAGTDFYSISAANAAFQPLDADLTTIAGLTATTNNFIVSVSSAWASRTPTQVKATLAIAQADVSGLTTASTPLFAGVDIGNVDTSITRAAAGVIAVEGVPLYAGIPQNSQSAAYTTVLADAQKHIYHPAGDNNARTFTIDSNANVAYPIGTAITFINEINTVTIAITSDTLVLAGTGATGSRSLAANGIATAIKVTSTRWVISGTGLT